ncbi:hypothetical protein EZS27_026984 [termite gut metagenome]|uniref:Uncharacterized protein n=1 Tax=termite gut metagenome TaxID=433724 RepID=A0A5J4QRC2_9ZZZZ
MGYVVLHFKKAPVTMPEHPPISNGQSIRKMRMKVVRI